MIKIILNSKRQITDSEITFERGLSFWVFFPTQLSTLISPWAEA